MNRLILLLLLALFMFPASAGALPYSEWEEPEGAYAGQAPKGTVIIVHGGGWQGSQEATQWGYIQAAADRFNGRGYRTLNVDYRTATSPGNELDGYYDIRDFVSIARWNIGNDKPVCVWGHSSGGHYAALAVKDFDVDCAFLEGSPVDLPALPDYTRGLAEAAFGGYAGFLSPIYYPANLQKPMAVGTAYSDDLVPLQTQAAPFRDRVNDHEPYTSGPVRAEWLSAGAQDCEFTHAMVDCAEVSAWFTKEREVLSEAVRNRR